MGRIDCTPHSRSRRAALRAVVVALTLAGAARCGRPAPAPGAEALAVLGSISDVDSWNEYVSRQDFAGKLQRRIFLRLARPVADANDGPAAFEPDLAESWEFSADGLALTFHLRPAVWSDGVPITAADVRFTWQAQTSPDVAWINAATKNRIETVEVEDERVVTFRFAQRYPHRLADAVEGGIVPAHVYGRVPFERWRTHDWSAEHVASGPFVLDAYRPGEEIALRRNPRYWRSGLPRLDRVVIRIVPDATNLLTQAVAGDIDYFEGLTPRDAERLAGRPELTLVAFDYPKYDYIGWNGGRPPFDDPELRRALTLAIDRESLVEELLHGYGRVSRGPVLSSSWAADPSLAPWPHDPAGARRILAERGWATDERDGRRLEFELVTNAGNRLREAMAVKIQQQLARVGVEVHLRTLEMGSLVERCSAGDYDAYLGGWTVLGKIDLRPLFGSDSLPPNGANIVRFRSSRVDGLLDRLETVEDWHAMKPLLDEIQRQIHAEQPYTFLYETQRIAVLGERLSGLRIEDPADPLRDLDRCPTDGS